MGGAERPPPSIIAAVVFVLAKKLAVRNLMKSVDVLKNSTIWLSVANVGAMEL